MVDWVCWTVSVVVVRVYQAKWQRSLLNLYWFYFHSFTIFFLHKLPSGNNSVLFVGAHVGGWCEPSNSATLIQCPCLACPSLHLASACFMRASSSEPKQQFHLFCQSWECTQPSLVVSPPAPIGCQTCGLHSCASLSLSLSLFHSVSLSLWQCWWLGQWGRVLRRCIFCYVILKLL